MPVSDHILIVGSIMLFTSVLAGSVNYLFLYFEGKITNNYKFFWNVLQSLGATLLVPLLLNMISSELISYKTNFDPMNYLVFAGFCFIAGYFADQFINSIGKKVLRELENVNSKVEDTIQDFNQQKDALDTLISSETEIDDNAEKPHLNMTEFKEKSNLKDHDAKTYMDNIIKSLSGKYKFRSVRGIAKEHEYSETIVKTMLEGLEKEGATKSYLRKDGNELWSLTQIGKLLIKS